MRGLNPFHRRNARLLTVAPQRRVLNKKERTGSNRRLHGFHRWMCRSGLLSVAARILLEQNAYARDCLRLASNLRNFNPEYFGAAVSVSDFRLNRWFLAYRPELHSFLPFFPMSTHPYAGKPAPKDLLIDVSRLEAAFYEGKPDPDRPQPARQLRHKRASRHQFKCDVYRVAYPCHYSGHLRIPAQPGNHWAAVYGQRHSRAFPTRRASRVGGAGRKRRRGIYSAR